MLQIAIIILPKTHFTLRSNELNWKQVYLNRFAKKNPSIANLNCTGRFGVRAVPYEPKTFVSLNTDIFNYSDPKYMKMTMEINWCHFRSKIANINSGILWIIFRCIFIPFLLTLVCTSNYEKMYTEYLYK